MAVERFVTLNPCGERRRDGRLDFPRAETEQAFIFKIIKLVISDFSDAPHAVKPNTQDTGEINKSNGMLSIEEHLHCLLISPDHSQSHSRYHHVASQCSN